jgi:hypothetical protein
VAHEAFEYNFAHGKAKTKDITADARTARASPVMDDAISATKRVRCESWLQ